MLPYGVGADSISARAIWGNAEPHGRALLAPTMHFFDSLRLPSRGATIRAAPKGSPSRTDSPDTGEVARSARGGTLSPKVTEGWPGGHEFFPHPHLKTPP